MSRLLGLVRALFPHLESPRERDEAFLAQAVDNYDLERRMREIDARASNQGNASPVATGLW